MSGECAGAAWERRWTVDGIRRLWAGTLAGGSTARQCQKRRECGLGIIQVKTNYRNEILVDVFFVISYLSGIARGKGVFFPETITDKGGEVVPSPSALEAP